jgi:hypothetical protein
VNTLESGDLVVKLVVIVEKAAAMRTYFRSSDRNFDRTNSTIPWIPFVSEFETDRQFVQFKIEGMLDEGLALRGIVMEWKPGT